MEHMIPVRCAVQGHDGVWRQSPVCPMHREGGVFVRLGAREQAAQVEGDDGALEEADLGARHPAHEADSHWQGLARVAMRDDLSALARSVLHTGAAASSAQPAALIDAWEAQREFQLARCRQLLADLKPAAALDRAMLSVLLRELHSLV